MSSQDRLALETDTTVMASSKVMISFNNNGIKIETAATYSVNFELTAPPPRLLQTSGTTTYTPVCKRFDSTTQSWVETGVSTQINADGSVSCLASQSGALTVVYEAPTGTTTPTTPTTTTDDGSSSSGSNMIIIAAGAGGGALFLIVLIVCIVCCVKRKQKKARQQQPRNKVLPTDMSDFEGVQTVGDRVAVKRATSGDYMIEGPRTTKMTATNRPLAAGDASDLSRSFDYMMDAQEEVDSTPQPKPRDHEVETLGAESPDKLNKQKKGKNKK